MKILSLRMQHSLPNKISIYLSIYFHGLVNSNVYGSRILITMPTSLSHVRDTACAPDIRTPCSIIVNNFLNVSLGNL